MKTNIIILIIAGLIIVGATKLNKYNPRVEPIPPVVEAPIAAIDYKTSPFFEKKKN